MILEDFVMLGTTVPEQMRDGRVVRCSAGYSPELRRLVRVYPISPFVSVPRWSTYRIELERNPLDSRDESWKLAGDRSDPEALTRRMVDHGCAGKVPTRQRLEQVDRFLAPSIAALNAERKSLGVLRPELLGFSFEYDQAADDAVAQLPGMETPAPEWGRHSFPRRPRIQFMDEDGRHDLSLNEHGAYEWLRKGGTPEQVFRNLKFDATDRDVRLLVGNLANQRTAWVVIAFLSFAKVAPSLFDLTPEEVVA